MAKTPLDVLSEIIEESFINIKTKDVECVADRDSKELARFVALGLRIAVVEYLPLVNSASSIGKDMLVSHEETCKMTRSQRNIRYLKVGYHFLHMLAKHKVIKIEKDEKLKRSKYMVYIKNVEFVDDLLGDLNHFPEDVKPVYVEPQFVQPKPFHEFNHIVAGPMVRNTHPLAWSKFDRIMQFRVFDVINKLQSTRYAINEDLYNELLKCKDDPLFTFEDKTLSEEQVDSKTKEMDVIMNLAGGILDRDENYRYFYQYMFYDWRGRIYSACNYLNHTGHKLAKALITFEEEKPIGEEGYFYLLVHAANCFGYDKDTIDGRYDFANKHLDEWISWAKDPVGLTCEEVDEETGEITTHKCWAKADSPFEFLAAIKEIAKAHAHEGGPYSYPSGLMISWDATCSGLQVLAALARDRHSAELSNISNSNERGDYYKMIADHVWEECAYTEKEEIQYKTIVDKLKYFEGIINDKSVSNEENKIAWDERTKFQKENGKLIYALSKVFWAKPKVASLRRKICKRMAMTYFYSCGPGTMADSLMEDFASEPEFKELNSVFCFWLAKRVHDACKKLMPKPTELMELFVSLGIKDYNEDRDFFITAPYTEFPMMQYYRKSSTRQVRLNYLGTRIRPVVAIDKDDLKNRDKVLSGTSPNVVHMLDAVILAAITLKSDYDIACVHDSFSASVADASKLYEDTRTAFHDVFVNDVLTDITQQKGIDHDIVYGDLEINEIFDNEQGFS